MLSTVFEHDRVVSSTQKSLEHETQSIESTTDISSEINSMEAELEQNGSLCLESCCRLELMKRQNVPK